MSDLENEVTQYESPNVGSGNAGGSDEYESPSHLHPPCGKTQQASGTEDQDYVSKQPVNDLWKLNVIIYTIEVPWMTLSTFFCRIPLHVDMPDNYFLKIKRKGLYLCWRNNTSPKKRQLRGIRSLNKMQQGIIRITTQYADGSPIEPESVLSKWQNDCGVVAREKCMIIWSWDVVTEEMQEILCGFIKEHYIFPSEQEKIGKNAMMRTISNALRRFRYALNKNYVQRGLSPVDLFGYIMPNEWDTFVQQHTTPQVVALSNKMKELNAKNKFRHKLGPVGYKAAMPKWAKKE
jgi:hypothetical protein